MTVNRVWEYSQNNPEGFTIHIHSWLVPMSGYAVAYKETQHCHDREDLPRVLQHALQHDGYVGGWLDSQSGRYYFDSVRILHRASEAEAFAREQEQLAFFDLTLGREIRVK